MTEMWVDGNELHLTISAPSGLLYQQTFAMAVVMAKIADESEVIRFTYDLVDPEDGTTTRGAARILIQEIPDPRAAAEETERQPERADATVCTDNCDGSDMCTGTVKTAPDQ